MNYRWKSNWSQCSKRFTDWWGQKGLLIGACGEGIQLDEPRENCSFEVPEDAKDFWIDARWRAAKSRDKLSRQLFDFDILPQAITDIGPGSLSLMLGSIPEFSRDTVWFGHRQGGLGEDQGLVFDEQNYWWQVHQDIISENIRLSDGCYMVGCPDLIENVDVVASLQGTEKTLMDMIERPGWLKAKLCEINSVYFDVYQRIYDLIKDEDDAASYGAYRLWAPGKVAKVQCDISSMFSPAMFSEFVVPPLREQCDWLDYSMYHLDGSQCLCHVAHLLEIESLNAIEWTPEPGAPAGGSSHWYELYRRIIKGGKSVLAVRVKCSEVIPLIDAVGADGLYIHVVFENLSDAEELKSKLDKYGY